MAEISYQRDPTWPVGVLVVFAWSLSKTNLFWLAIVNGSKMKKSFVLINLGILWA